MTDPMDELRQASADLQQTQNLTPPPELVREWMTCAHDQPPGADARVIANLAAQWGADQELKACCQQLEELQHGTCYPVTGDKLRAARRPKPPSLAEEALNALELCAERDHYVSDYLYWAPIVKALKRLQQLEEQQ